MTAPDAPPRCGTCRAPSQWITAVGRRCDSCVRFSPAHAVHLAVTGQLVDSLRYCRAPHGVPS